MELWKRMGAEHSWMMSVPKGWMELFEKLIAEMESTRIPFRVLQAKEKFGQLCVYEFTGNHRDIIQYYVRLASKTCQLCGYDEEVSTQTINEWIYAVCDDCAADIEAKNEAFPKDEKKKNTW